jgi:diguanylate cyclase (GGDEF)-like protein
MGDGGLRADVRALTRRPLLLSLLVLGGLETVRFALDPRTLDLVVLLLIGVVTLAAARERGSVAEGEGTRRTEAESFARILRGLSRSVSPDAIVDAIVEELGIGTGADHVAVVRRRPDTHNLEAILSPTRPGAPASRTTMSLRELEDPAQEQAAAAFAIAASRGRRMTAVPIEPDPDGDPDLVPLGIGGRRQSRKVLGLPDGPSLMAEAGGAAVSGGAAVARGAAVATATLAPVARRTSQATSAREGADQRIADRIAGRLRDAYGLRNLLAAPLRVNGRVEGAIILSRRVNVEWPESTHRFLEAAAVEVSAALARVYSMREAETRASTDALTGLPNRRYFDEYLGLLGRRRRAEDRVGVLMIDIDRFKRLNDTFGHAVGDHVLREVAQAIASAVRDDDVPARFGGEEFAVLLKNPSAKVALDVGERVRRAVSGLDLRRLGVPGVSVSVGVAVAEDPDVALDVVIDEADRALYRAKRGGRDRVVAA